MAIITSDTYNIETFGYASIYIK